MILVLAGTGEAYDLVRRLYACRLSLEVSTVTDHAARVYRREHIPVRTGRLDRCGLLKWIRKKGGRLLVDATHPFAEKAHFAVRDAARAAGIPCYRLERPPLNLADGFGLHRVSSDREAASLAARLGGTVFLTTGSKGLPVYARRLSKAPGVRLVVRLLPTVENLRLCDQWEIDQSNIVAMQGPFGRGIDAAMLRHFSADVLITKESGGLAWIREKIEDALAAGLQVVVVERPPLPEGMRVFHDCSQLVRSVQEQVGIPHG
ncbi:precorrin-6A/cobalt-precorrin-6A reductase [Melghirimyces profundicolus]|uniref:Precorrin-6A/cobalt-precorrin-6A reductase n=1 Tax=Melghirimyces profundicolus TaxID=1242148 RepID=A0A2T6C8C7_9BACL|nr:precorrin-6A reductase [Melghirimyces profundicolus]PTX64567.1 precorrin-6A/cobalt-precorrin-6A reductase [Melghirimyces profundicolus]